MIFRAILSLPIAMFNVYSHTLTDFYHNHLDIPTHYPKKSPAKETECIRSSSGLEQTHPCLADSKLATVGPKVERKDEFTCKGGVDAGRLLNLARKSLYSTAKKMGGNVLLDERWDCEIRHPRSQYRDQFKVIIHYSATVARSHLPDAQKPIEIQAAKGIMGLMTVIDRHPEF